MQINVTYRKLKLGQWEQAIKTCLDITCAFVSSLCQLKHCVNGDAENRFDPILCVCVCITQYKTLTLTQTQTLNVNRAEEIYHP